MNKKKTPSIMGILNLSPESFSDGGEFNTIKKAIKRVKEMEKEGANIIDIGAESSGPNSKNINEKEELNRLIPVLKEIRKTTKLSISIDTYKAKTAEECLKLGANIINDITALRGDKNMTKILAKYNCPVVLMYSKDSSARTTIKNKKYKDIIKTIKTFWKERIQYALEQGIKKENIILDPGFGHFISAIPKYSFEIISRLKEFKPLKHQILIGISRKSALGGEMKTRDDRGEVLSAIATLNGASIIRTHDVKGLKNFLSNFQ